MVVIRQCNECEKKLDHTTGYYTVTDHGNVTDSHMTEYPYQEKDLCYDCYAKPCRCQKCSRTWVLGLPVDIVDISDK
jgi:hypothetical protein